MAITKPQNKNKVRNKWLGHLGKNGLRKTPQLGSHQPPSTHTWVLPDP